MTRRQRIMSAVSAVLIVVVFTTAAMAAWQSSGLGTAAAQAAGMPQGATPVAVLNATGGVDVSWTASVLSDGTAVSAYSVRRSDGTTTVDVAACQETALTSCFDNIAIAGSYTYFVTPVQGTWTGAESDASNAVTIGSSVVPPASPTLTQTPSDPSFDTTATFAFDSPTATAYQCQLGAEAPTTCTSPKTYSALTTGSYTFSVTASNAGGTSAPTTFTWNVVALAPAAPAIATAPDNPTNSTSASFTFSADRALSYECKRENEPTFTACTSPKAYTTVADGTHTFSVRGVNPIGTGPSTDYTWTVDTQAPGAPTIDVKPPAFTTATTADFEFSGGASALPSTYKCKLDTAPGFTPCTSPQQYTGLSSGSHTFQVLASNANGDGAPTSYTWTVDTVAPTITFTSRTSPNAAGWNNTDVIVNWTCADGGSGPVNAAVTQTLTAEGSNLSSIGTCTDLAGNTASNTQVGIKIDKSAPVTTDDSATTGDAWRNTNATVTLTPGAAISGSKATYYTINGTTPTTSSAQGTSVALTATGTYAVKYFSVDNADNTEAVKTAGTTIRIDKANPSAASLLTPVANATIANGQVFTGSGTDADSGVASITYLYCAGTGCTPSTSIGTSSTATGNYPVAWNSQPADGTYTVAARVADAAGNTLTSASRAVTVTNTVTINAATWYLKTDAAGNRAPNTQHLPLSTVAPTVSVLPNYDTSRDSDAGLTIAPAVGDPNQTDVTKHQDWSLVLSATNPSRLQGTATFTFSAAVRNFATGERAHVRAYLQDCASVTAASDSCTTFANNNFNVNNWHNGSGNNTWRQGQISFSGVNQVIAAGRALRLKVVVENNAGDSMWLAYDTTTYTSQLVVTP